MNNTVKPLVSVITPVHNEEEHLAECIESILAQTYDNWDYTIIDNGSTDGSLEVARQYAARDGRIRIAKTKELLDVIPNHSLALRHISPESKYCKLVFGDDWLFPDCLEQMVKVAEEHPSVGIVGAFVLEGVHVKCTGLPISRSVIPGREICRRHFLEKLYVFGSANSVLYRADLVRLHDPFYNAGNIHADTEVCFDLLTGSDFGFVHQVLTYTRVRPGSLATCSERVQTCWAGMLRILVTYGPSYLTQEEAAVLLDRHLAGYYRYLARVLILGRPKEAWEYHKSKLAEAGMPLSQTRLTAATVRLVADALLSPGESVQKVRQHLHAWWVGYSERHSKTVPRLADVDEAKGQGRVTQPRADA